MLGALALLPLHATAAEPDYSSWNALLAKYYSLERGLDYSGMKSRDRATLNALRERMGRVNVSSLTRNEQLAYWINLYNISTVATVIDRYPVDSIRDISTDPIIRLNVFKKATIPFHGRKVSLNWIEHEKIRADFSDPRIHFAINCAARSCPPLREEAFVGARVHQQLDEQTRRFLTGSRGARVTQHGGRVTLYTTKIMDWFGDDFRKWGGIVAFVKRYVAPAEARLLARGDVRVKFDPYDWSLNDWRR